MGYSNSYKVRTISIVVETVFIQNLVQFIQRINYCFFIGNRNFVSDWRQ